MPLSKSSVARWITRSLIVTLTTMGALQAQDIPPGLSGTNAPANSVWLDSLDLSHVIQGYGAAQAGHTIETNAITLAGVAYPRGVATHAIGHILIDLHGAATRFQAVVGVDDEVKKHGSVTFSVWIDGKRAKETGVMRGGDQPQLISVDLTGAQRLALLVGDGRDGYEFDHADWAGASITLAPDVARKPEMVAIVDPPPRLKILPEDPKPAIHGAPVVGATPGHPFLFRIAATGTGPLRYAAHNLPSGLKLDETTGSITGSLQQAGTTRVALTVSGPSGTAQRGLTIVGGVHRLAQTPPMGWNSWNVWGNSVDEGKVKAAANQLIGTGLAAHGFQYVNIDQAWSGQRDAQGTMMSNEKFPDMKALCDEVHRMGLKIGIYSSPGPKTCGEYFGSYQHEDQDAQTYGAWGFDYLKYDWCSYGEKAKDNSLGELMKPYQIMRAALDKVPRDIVFSLCQYGMGNVWEWGARLGGNCWRTFGDIGDFWSGRGEYTFGMYDILQAEVGHAKYAGPGHWNDPDMLMVGVVGFGNTHPTHLTPDEQLIHISMWCLLSSPLLIGCDLTKLDPFTLAILTNDELLDIDQDPLGKPADRISKDANDGEVWFRELADGTRAVALLNGAPEEQTLSVQWPAIGLAGKQAVRDLWLHENVGAFDGGYSVAVPSHGIVVVKIGALAE